VEEIELRALAYQKEYPGITYIECDLDQLNDYDFVRQMFQTLGLVPTRDLQDTVGRPLNKRSECPRLSMDELLALPDYPSADRLAPGDRDALVADMVAYLHRHKAREIAAMRPDYAMGGTLGVDAIRIVTHAEKELEEAFQRSLLFTETEVILISEFLRSVAPYDVYLLDFCDSRRQDRG
jgi:hypothetical protein